MKIHPKARPVISSLSIPSPIKKYFSGTSYEIDLSNNTNPYLGDYAQYPDVKQDYLKQLYLSLALSLNLPPHFERGKSLSPENILLTAGSMEGLDLILRTFLEPNKDILCITTPTFPAYEHWALIHGVQVKTVPLFGDNFDQVSISDILRFNPKVVFLCDPNNPIGSKLKSDLIQKLCESFEGIVVVDEAYIEFSDHPSSIFALHNHSNLIILRTLSKAWGLAGLRCGVILADQFIINALRYVQLPFAISSLTQAKVMARVLHPQKTFKSWDKIKKDRNSLVESLLSLPGVIKVFKSDTNFVLVILKNFRKTMAMLKEHKIHVLDCSACVPNSIRVSLGNEEQNKKFLDVLQRTCSVE